jgi:hypothetical protein
MAPAWERLSKGIVLEAPEGNDARSHTFLGMEHKFSERRVQGKLVKVVEWDCSHQIARAIAKYEEAVFSLTGMYPRMYTAKTPFLDEETKFAECRASHSSGDFVECPSCMDTFPAADWKEHPAGTKRPIRKLRSMITDMSQSSEGGPRKGNDNKEVLRRSKFTEKSSVSYGLQKGKLLRRHGRLGRR